MAAPIPYVHVGGQHCRTRGQRSLLLLISVLESPWPLDSSPHFIGRHYKVLGPADSQQVSPAHYVCLSVRPLNPRLSVCLDSPHGPCVRGMDFNPNKPHHFSSCGDDCTVKFWDSRHLALPLATRQDHSHWYDHILHFHSSIETCRVWTVQYNLFHDQLVLSGSSDSRVVLTRMASIASEPLHALDDDSAETWVMLSCYPLFI